MSVLSSWFGGTTDPNEIYEKNVAAIKNFSNAPPQAMIKSFGEGVLDRADGMLRYYSTWTGTQLHDTVPIIANTAQQAFAHYKPHEGKIDSNRLRELKDQLAEEFEILQGIQRIYDVYTQRYENEPEHKGLQELKEIRDNYAHQFEENMQEYQGIIEAARQTTDISQSVYAPQFGKEITPEQAASSLSDYCEKYCPGILSYEASNMIEKGSTLMENIMSGKKTSLSENPEDELAQLTWFLMDCALKKGQGYDEGTFVIEDPQERLYNFLLSGESYLRDSSHYVGRSPKKHHGIDVFNGKMPAHKRTILFEMIDNPDIKGMPKKVLFFKPENWSAHPTANYGYDFTMHGYEFLAAQYNKFYHPGSDDLPSMRKERVPVAILNAFNQYIRDINEALEFSEELIAPLSSEQKELIDPKKAAENAKRYGIAYMKHVVDTLSEVPEKPKLFEAPELKALFNAYDHSNLRTGREVYIIGQ